MTVGKIKIDFDRRLGVIDRRIYGHFIEHLGRCIYGGIYDPGSPLSNEQGFRKDVMDAISKLKVPLLRWPGGDFVSAYHWIDGVGPREKRPRRMEIAWGSEESNAFGTDEFIVYCREIGAEPFICVNMGTGTIDEACSWLEYCNGQGNTFWANLRRQNGAASPYNVKYWALGNEIYGEWEVGAKTVDEYCHLATEYSKAMRRIDPSIEFIACGKDGMSDWDLQVAERVAPFASYYSIHIYTGSPNYYNNVFAPHQSERALQIMKGVLGKAHYSHPSHPPMRIAYDEWNVWYRDVECPSAEVFDLSDALAVATYLNIFQRNCSLVVIANLAQLVNVLAPIVTSKDNLFLQSIYFPIMLYVQHSCELAVDAYVDCETLNIDADDEQRAPWHLNRVRDLGPFSLLDVSATIDEKKKQVTLAVINRSDNQDIETSIQAIDAQWKPDFTIYEVNAPCVHAYNSISNPNEIGVKEKHLENMISSDFRYVFPAHSLSVCKLHLA